MKQILKNLWSQRAQNVWLFAELVVVCFVAWTQIDPIAVRLFYQNQPAGFDIDRLVVADARLYKTMGQVFTRKKGLSYYVISPHEEFESFFGQKADKRRKLYNGMIKCQVYMYFKGE
jgi:23S rRNA G2445 N2-methylase RlmL